MKKRNIITSLVVAGALCASSLLNVSAATWPGIGLKETDVEKVTYQFMDETQAGKYKLVNTDTMKSWVDKKEKMIVVDTMPASSYSGSNGHIAGAINSVAPMKEAEYTAEQKADLIKQVNELLPNKTVTKKVSKTSWVKVSKKTYLKAKKADRKIKKVKKGKKTVTTYYKKKVTTSTQKTTVKDKNYKIVVYCGHIGCARSHVAGAYLVKQGYTNVYRYGGGITAWLDAGYEVEGKEAPTTAAPTTEAPTTSEAPVAPTTSEAPATVAP